MACIYEIKLTMTDVIAIISMLVSGLSALYAGWSWNESRKANEISLLGHRKEIYNAFFELKMHMVSKRMYAEASEVSKFYYQKRNAQIYLPVALALKIGKYFDACFEIAEIHKKFGETPKGSIAESAPHLDVEKKLAPEIDKEFLKLLQEIQA